MRKDKLIENPNFGYLLTGQFISTFGDSVYLVAVLWMATNYTDSASELSLISIFDTIPAVIIGLLSGAVVDRNIKKNMMIFADGGRCILVMIFAVLYLSDWVNIYCVYILTFFMAIFQCLYNPAQFALLPLIVKKENLNKANSISTVTLNAVVAFGNAIGGYIVSFIGTIGVLLIDAVTFVVSIICTKKIIYKETPLSRSMGMRKTWANDIKDALLYVKNNHFICLLLLLNMCLNIISGAFYILPLFVKNVLNNGSELYGTIEGAGTIGMIFGAGVIIRAAKPTYKLLSISAIMECACFIGIALSRNVWIIIVLRFLLGCSNAAYNTSFATMSQEKTQEKYRGRVYTISYMVSTISLPISAFICGKIADLKSVTYTWLLFGIIATIVSIAICTKLAHRSTTNE